MAGELLVLVAFMYVLDVLGFLYTTLWMLFPPWGRRASGVLCSASAKDVLAPPFGHLEPSKCFAEVHFYSCLLASCCASASPSPPPPHQRCAVADVDGNAASARPFIQGGPHDCFGRGLVYFHMSRVPSLWWKRVDAEQNVQQRHGHEKCHDPEQME